METVTRSEAPKQTRRSRRYPKASTGVVTKTVNDVRGFGEPLARYGELPTSHLTGLYNAIQGLPEKSVYGLNRLAQLYHESEGMPPSRQLFMRPPIQWRHGFMHMTIYRKTIGTSKYVHSMKLYTPRQFRWSNIAQVVQVPDSPHEEASDHDSALALVASSLEIAARRSPHIKRYITHIDILTNASHTAQDAPSPLSIPIPKIEYDFDGGRVTLTDIHLKPDNLLGLEYHRPEWKFFAVEYDRSTEDMEPTKTLSKASWLRKFIGYSAVSMHPSPIYSSYLGVLNLMVLCVFEDAGRMRRAMKLCQKVAKYPEQFLFKTVPPVDPLLNATIMTDLLTEPWQTATGSRFNIETLERQVIATDTRR